MRALVAFGASLLIAAWLYIHPPKPPTGLAPIIKPYVREFPAGDPMSWMDEYYQERRETAERKRREGLAKLHAEKQAVSKGWAEWLGDPAHVWPHLAAEGNTSDL